MRLKMSKPTNIQAYKKVKELIEAIDRRDTSVLESHFEIPSIVAEEIYECIDEFFDEGTRLSISPEAEAFSSGQHSRPFIDTYETNDEALGMECVIFANNKPSEAILHLELSESEGKIKTYYKYIGS